MELDLITSEDEIGGYTPLERPTNLVNPVHNPVPEQIVYSDDDAPNNSSSYDSDEAHTQIVKSKVKRKAMPSATSSTSRNEAKKTKYSIWSDILQEEAIENQFVGSQFFGGSYRGNESYNYKMKHMMEIGNSANDGSSEQPQEKTEHRKKIKAHHRYRNRSAKSPIIPRDLQVTAVDLPELVAADIADKLNELKPELIVRVVNALGNERAIDVFYQTKEAEKNGGILTLDGARRRTSGGVYLKFVKDLKLTKDEYQAIFIDDRTFKPFKNKKGKWKKKTDENLKELPTRYELEMSMSNEEDTNNLKNPPPSPAYPCTVSPSAPFSLSDSEKLNSISSFQKNTSKNKFHDKADAMCFDTEQISDEISCRE